MPVSGFDQHILQQQYASEGIEFVQELIALAKEAYDDLESELLSKEMSCQDSQSCQDSRGAGNVVKSATLSVRGTNIMLIANFKPCS
jgi:hypothetical protein